MNVLYVSLAIKWAIHHQLKETRWMAREENSSSQNSGKKKGENPKIVTKRTMY